MTDDKMSDESWAGRVAIVTGGASGMGRATALAFARNGACVVVADVSDQAGAETARLITEEGGVASFVHTNVTSSEDVQAMVRHAVNSHGGLNFAVNCAGTLATDRLLADEDDDTFDKIMNVNLRSVFLGMKYEIKQMLEAGKGGAIVNVASVNGTRPRSHQSLYTSSKHAVLGMTRNAALEYAGKGIRINAVCPGAIDTPMARNAASTRGGSLDNTARAMSLLGRVGTADEVANAIVWLCSDRSTYVVGHPLVIDGGYLTM